MTLRILLVCTLAASAAGCYPERKESPTTGELQVLIPESAAPPLIREVESFLGVYGPHGAHITYRVVRSQEAISRFILDTARLIFTTQPLSKAEEDLVRNTAGSLASIVVAYDGIVAAVHHKNPVERISAAEIRKIIAGSVTHWEDLQDHRGKRGRIVVIVEDSSDAEVYLEQNLLRGAPVSVNHRSAHGSLEVLRGVVSDENSLGFVGLSWIDSARVPAKLLEVSASGFDPDTVYAIPAEALGKFYGPHPAHIYRNYYPFKRGIHMYTKSLKGDLASGFGTFVAAKEGQRVFLETGLVPATQPIRLRPSQ